MKTVIGENYYAGILDDLIINQDDDDVFEKLEVFLKKNKDKTKLLFISYDLKNKIEKLNSRNDDKIKFPVIRCVVPEKIFSKKKFVNLNKLENKSIKFIPELNKEDYLKKIEKVKSHIQKGDIYETNFCYNWEAKGKINNPYKVYQKLEELTKAPFSVYSEVGDHVIISASPERFIKRRGDKLISEPIKGTSKRSKNKEIDSQLIKDLRNDPKERSENVMIVDLVRNDLSKVAKENSVNVEKLCEVNTFENIHQMISTVSCNVEKETSFSKILKALFPMGSMTGVPKVKAMELMEKYELTKRGLYSGAIGVMKPSGDFDLNVVIRTIIYNKANDFISFKVGGAITIKSKPEKEYEETLIKAEALLKACQQ